VGFKARILRDDGSSATGIEIPFDPKAELGSARAPVVVTVNGHSYRTTTAIMGGVRFVPLSRANREAAGVQGGQVVDVHMELDTAPRTVTPPPDLSDAMRAAGVQPAWDRLSFSHQREHVEAIEDARKPETRARRIARAVALLRAHW